MSEDQETPDEKLDPRVREIGRRLQECVQLVGGGNRLAQLSGINRRTLGYYLAGDRQPRTTELVDLARGAKVSIAWLAAGEGARAVEDAARAEIAGALQVNEERRGYAVVNNDLLARCIASVDRNAPAMGLTLAHDKKAFIATVAYLWFRDRGEEVTDEAFHRFMEKLL